MRKSRILYLSIMIIEAVTIFFSSSSVLFGLFIAQSLVLLFLWTGLAIDTVGLKPKLKVPAACMVGSEPYFVLEIGKKLYLAAGVMEAVLECENVMMDETTELPVRIVFSGKNHMIRIPFKAEVCGQLHIRLKRIRFYDIFGVMRRDMPHPEEQILMVYPKKAAITVTVDNQITGRLEGEQKTIERSGKNMSEVFELCEYKPGDDVRRIHWKLSGKLGKMIMRQAGDTFKSDIFVLLDVGHKYEEEQYPVTQMSAAVSAAISISLELSKLRISHYLGISSNERLIYEAIENQTDFNKTIDLWLAVKLTKKRGNGISHFMLEQFHENCNKLIYITNGTCPKAFFELPPNLRITALCIVSEKDESMIYQQGNWTIMEIPAGELWRSDYAIAV